MKPKKPKMVRDKVKDIPHEKYKDFQWHFAGRREYWQLLLEKVTEEAGEVASAKTDNQLKEELADLQEAIDAIIKFKGLSRRSINKIKKEKRKCKGGFDLGVIWDNAR